MHRSYQPMDLQKLLTRSGQQTAQPEGDEALPEVKKWLELADVLLDAETEDDVSLPDKKEDSSAA